MGYESRARQKAAQQRQPEAPAVPELGPDDRVEVELYPPDRPRYAVIGHRQSPRVAAVLAALAAASVSPVSLPLPPPDVPYANLKSRGNGVPTYKRRKR